MQSLTPRKQSYCAWATRKGLRHACMESKPSCMHGRCMHEDSTQAKGPRQKGHTYILTNFTSSSIKMDRNKVTSMCKKVNLHVACMQFVDECCMMAII